MLTSADIRALMAETGLKQAQLAERLGVSQPTVSRWLKGSTPDPAQEAALRALMASSGSEPPRVREQRQAPEFRVVEDAPAVVAGEMPRDVPVMGIAVGGEDHDFELNGEVVDYVRRPPGIANRKGVYALLILGTSMMPRFRENELTYIDSRRGPAIGEDGVFELERDDEDQDRPARALIKTLLRRGPTKITVEQYNPAKSWDIELRDIRAQHRVIPLAELLGY